MSRPFWRGYLVLIASVVVAGWLQGADANKENPVADTPTPKAATAVKKADNSRCQVCHINYEEEEFAVLHAKQGIGCTQCHGESKAHSNDEDNITAPDIMYPRAKITAACLKCHASEKLGKTEVHKPFLSGSGVSKEYCTDCHGEHRLKSRRNQWDKATGKLLKPEKKQS
jgi:hypothetical protein